jgi:hypothetical protein
MKRTRLSLFYLVSYLAVGGIGFVFFPRFSLDLFLSTVAYEITMVRLVGVLLLSLAIIVAQIIRHGAVRLYPTTLLVRALILVVLIWQYISGGDPLFLVLTAIVGLGFILTGLSYLSERA